MNQELSLHPCRCASPPSRRTTSRRACSPPAPSQTQTTFTSQDSPRVNASRITHSGIVAQTQTAFGAIRAELARFGGTLARIVATVVIIIVGIVLIALVLRRHARTLQRRRQGHHPLRRVWHSSLPPRMTKPAPPLPTNQLWRAKQALLPTSMRMTRAAPSSARWRRWSGCGRSGTRSAAAPPAPPPAHPSPTHLAGLRCPGPDRRHHWHRVLWHGGQRRAGRVHFLRHDGQHGGAAHDQRREPRHPPPPPPPPPWYTRRELRVSRTESCA